MISLDLTKSLEVRIAGDQPNYFRPRNLLGKICWSETGYIYYRVQSDTTHHYCQPTNKEVDANAYCISCDTLRSMTVDLIQIWHMTFPTTAAICASCYFQQ